MPKDSTDLVLFRHFHLTVTGMTVAGKPTFEQWVAVGRHLAHAERSVHWAIGDWLNIGMSEWGDKYSQQIDAIGFSYNTLSADRWLSNIFEFLRRRKNLTWGHHRVVASLDEEDQDALLDEAEPPRGSKKPALTEKELRERVRQFKREKYGTDDSGGGDDAAPFSYLEESNQLHEWLRQRMAVWPPEMRPLFVGLLRSLSDNLEIEFAREGTDHDARRDGTRSA